MLNAIRAYPRVCKFCSKFSKQNGESHLLSKQSSKTLGDKKKKKGKESGVFRSFSSFIFKRVNLDYLYHSRHSKESFPEFISFMKNLTR